MIKIINKKYKKHECSLVQKELPKKVTPIISEPVVSESITTTTEKKEKNTKKTNNTTKK
jgi:hypothetical protein